MENFFTGYTKEIGIAKAKLQLRWPTIDGPALGSKPNRVGNF